MGEKVVQLMPDLAPVVPTQTRLCLGEAATVLGKSPGTEAGRPMGVSLVGSEGEMENMLSVLEPALTAKRFWGACVLAVGFGDERDEGRGTYVAGDCQ